MLTVSGHQIVLDGVAAAAREAGVFGDVVVQGDRVIAKATASAAPAEYRVEVSARSTTVGVYTTDRWLSHSVEADLLHTGDDLASLLKDELEELGYRGPDLTVEHFRDDDKFFVFRSVTGVQPTDPQAVQRLSTLLRGYEACFRHLGDMHQDDEND